MRPKTTCKERGCDRKTFGRGLCNKHYQKVRHAERLAIPHPTGSKVCKNCKQEKLFSQFVVHPGCKDGYRPDCKECLALYNKEARKQNPERERRYLLRRVYKMTVADYDKILADQGRGCAICGQPEQGRKNYKFLCVDHNHQTGKVRGLLCVTCNAGIGQFYDNPDLLMNAASYLKKRSI